MLQRNRGFFFICKASGDANVDEGSARQAAVDQGSATGFGKDAL